MGLKSVVGMQGLVPLVVVRGSERTVHVYERGHELLGESWLIVKNMTRGIFLTFLYDSSYTQIQFMLF